MKTVSCHFKDAKVLVAEDNDASLEIIKHMLNLMQISPDIALNGEEAVEFAKKNSYDLLILDIHMPKMDGNQATREIRTLDVKQPIIVALTASVFTKENQDSLDAGFDDYLNKPIELEGIELLLRKHLVSKLVES